MRRAHPAVLLVPVAWLAGCFGPAPQGFDSPEPGRRIEAAVRAAERGDRSASRPLISMLDSDDPAARLVAIRALERITGQTLGYDHAAPEGDRRRAVERWMAWEAEQGEPR
ncbi:MAG: hypothetical protein FJ255_01765 [Phycisphaerae bacterium]|nr:hypothetical protein [Phycisphaerae bacterium]